MDFLNDLAGIIKSEFTEQEIRYPADADIWTLTSLWLEMRIRRFAPVPRTVHFSDKIHDTLGELAKDASPEASEAWTTVFYLRHLLVTGESVASFLSDRVSDAQTTDGLLWDYAIHHLHLSRDLGRSGFVKRSKWLLLAIVSDADVYFVDVRSHKNTDGLLWVRQDFLRMVHDNWPELTGAWRLNGVSGSNVSDIEKKELRRKNVNAAHEVGGYVVAPLGRGMTGDGHSTLCRFLAAKLLHEIKWHQENADLARGSVRATLCGPEIPSVDDIKLQLVRLDDREMTPDLTAKVDKARVGGNELIGAGFAILASWSVLDRHHFCLVSM